MTVENLSERLAAHTQAFADAKVNVGDELPEDGDYQAIVDEFDFFEGKDGTAYLKTMMRVTHDKENEGAKVWTIHNLEDPDLIGYVKDHLSRLGCDMEVLSEDFSALEKQLETVLDTPVEVRVKTSDKINQTTGEAYRNCWIQRNLGPPLRGDLPQEEFPDRTATDGKSDDDMADVPF